MSPLSDIQELKTDETTAIISQGHTLMQSTMAAIAVKLLSSGEIQSNPNYPTDSNYPTPTLLY